MPETRKLFGLMLRRPASKDVFIGPSFDDPRAIDRLEPGDFVPDVDPRPYDPTRQDPEWSLSLPHQCGEWAIGIGDRSDVLEAARQLRSQLDDAIAALEASSD